MTAACLLALSVTIGIAPPSPGGERYFMVVFGAQSVPYRTKYTHTWATFLKATPAAGGGLAVEVDTVSWLPATLDIRPLAVRHEPGVNLTLDETFRWVGSFGGRASMWGPFEIDADRYHRYIARKADPEGGAVAYRAIGSLTHDPTVSNCGQSFTRAAPVVGRRYLQPTPKPGEDGSGKLVRRYVMAGGFLNPGVTHDELLPALGIDYPVTRRQPGERVPLFRR